MSNVLSSVGSFVLILIFVVVSSGVHARFSDSAMTTVLARPLGGYGLTPLIFEPNGLTAAGFLSLGSTAVETKVRKSPVYELIMPNFDDEPTSSLAPAAHQPKPKPMKKIDYESLVSTNTNKANNKVNRDKVLAPAPSNSYYSGNDMFNDMFGKSNSFNDIIPSYKEPIGDKFMTTKGGYGGGGGGGSQSYGPVSAAIKSMRTVEVKPVQDEYQNNEPQVIDIAPSAQPIVINFRTTSSHLQVHQSHEPAEPAEVQTTRSEEEATYLKHSVVKPVIQELHEIIMPKRNIIQEIMPVEEEVRTIVARGKPRSKGSMGGGKGYSSGGGASSAGSGGYAAAASNGSAKKALPASAKYKS